MNARAVGVRAASSLVLGLASAAAVTHAAGAAAAVTSVPRPDHVVIVVEENHSQLGIIGNPAAPYLNSLASGGANFTNMYAETHPSQPNYVALFSGSTQGLTDDSCPHTYSGANLGSELIASGAGFVGYSESLPAVGSTVCTSGRYARKHNPWSDFTNVPGSASQPFTAFPSDYSTLPAVSFVIPNLDDDMHDGSIAQGDAWLQSNLSSYAGWAQTHNSLLVVTFDEDDGSEANKIPTVIYGAGVVAGNYNETINHYNLLRTVEDAYGLAPVGASATASPILDIWQGIPGSPPTAAFTSSCTQLVCSFDASGSADLDGTITGYAWDFGDGTSGSGVMPVHSYAGSGTDTVTLTVTDNDGHTASISHTVAPVAPAGSPFVSDDFNRTVASGLGTAPVGGAWGLVGGASNFAVSPGAGTFKLSKAGTRIEGFVGPAQTDASLVETFAMTKVPTGSTAVVSVTPRRQNANNAYYARIFFYPGGALTLRLCKLVGGVESVIAGPITLTGLTYTDGASLSARADAVGTNPTTVRARIWRTTQSEPSSWQLTATDTTAGLQAAGQVATTGYATAGVTNTPFNYTVSSFVANATAAPVNTAPTAAFTASCTQLTCSFDGQGSSDAEGPIAAYQWDFGDGATGSGSTPVHAYVSAGSYTVTLQVTDGGGLTGSVSHPVTATAPPVNQPPTAAFTASCTGLSCTFDGSGSNDPDGTIVAYAWDFGDGASASGSPATHSFAAAGTYQVSLTVTDDDDATDVATQSVQVSQAAVQPPTARFTFICTQLACTFDGSSSSDPDGVIASYSWDFGDGTGSTSPAPSHTFGAAGTYPVSLTVTDNDAATDTATQAVTVAAPSVLASDSFNRTVATGWGTADTGGTWTATAPSRAAVAAGRGTLRLDAGPGQSECYLPGSQTGDEVTATFSLDRIPVGGPAYVGVTARRLSSGAYVARVLISAGGTVTIRLSRMSASGAETVLAPAVRIPGSALQAGQSVSVRVQAVGTAPTTLRARAWPTAGTEPTGWQVTATDATAALQAAGGYGISGYLSTAITNGPITVAFSAFAVAPTSL